MSDGKMIIYKTVLPANVEIAERRGLGHPDALCGALAERISMTYARYCYENLDHTIIPYAIEGLTMADGESAVEFGGGQMIKPIRLYLRGGFATQAMGKKIPHLDIARQVIYDYLEQVIPNLDARKWVRVIDGIQGYGGPSGYFKIDELVANHMYAVKATYPLTPAETTAMKIEQLLSSPAYKKSNPFVGADNKIIVTQNGNSVDILAYVSMVSRYVSSEKELWSHLAQIKNNIIEIASSGRTMVSDIDIYSSATPLLDGRAMTYSGSSVESYNGAAVGRSRYPVYHAEKIYSVVAHRIAKRIFSEEHAPCSVELISKVGWPMITPWRTIINLFSTAGNTSVSQSVWTRVQEIANDELEKVGEVVLNLMYDKTKI